ncbi:hypothetical protein AVEN_73792-1 [Araneus ventricosus]|uniref:Uncharacterized protein n=1 Tax=Araneus ventricosus TaxID=182803 RepID=A0A4Y2HDX5_ARAVE|nr:hypothetical protein AVEN_73792-1 [Araneus ventricosus]
MESDAQIPLVDRAAIVVAASVWYHEDVMDAIRKAISSKSYEQNYWVKTQSRVTENIQSLPLTVLTKHRVQDFSAFITNGIQQWLQDNYFLTIDGKVLSNLLCWNPKGVIDCTETAKRVISHESNIINRFRIACMYCLENYIFQLWEELIEHHYLQYNILMECFEVKFWISYIKHNLSTLMDEIEYIGSKDTLWFAFNISVTNNNVIWIEHFLKKMREDQMCIMAYSKLKYILEMKMAFNYKMIPLLSRYVSSEMFDDLILSYPGTILLQFLQFPTTGSFLKIANKTWDVLSDDDFYKITEKIGHYLQEYAGNQIFKNIFESFWRNSPDHCKIYVIRKCIDGSFLNRLGLLRHSSPIIKLIIQSSTIDQRKEMIFSYNGILFFDSLVRKSRWGCFCMSVQEFSGSEDRENWINDLICTYKCIFETSRFPSFKYKGFEKLIDVLEKQKNKNICTK